MTPRARASLALLLSAAALIAACNVNQNVGSRYAKSALVPAGTGGTVAVTAADDLALAGTAVTIPPGALAADTTITIAEASALALPDGTSAAGPAVELGPSSASFAHPVTIVLPFHLEAGQAVDWLSVQAVDASGATVLVPNADLVVDVSAGTLAFTASHLFRCVPVWRHPDGKVCPSGERFCGCCGNGACIPQDRACPLTCPVCRGDGGVVVIGGDGGHGGGDDGGVVQRDGGSGGGSCCPAGETFCGCGGLGTCIPAGKACPLAATCPPSTDPTLAPTCCGPGTYLCGCGGHGVCIPDTIVCPLRCPVCDPATIPTPCGCLVPGARCGCDGTSPSTVPCQCRPVPASPLICVVDAGNPCPDPAHHLTPCGCLPAGALCVRPDAGSPCADPTEHRCCDDVCVPAGIACGPVCMGGDGGVHGPRDGG